MSPLPRPARRGLLVAHVVSSVGWLGLTLCLLVLAVAGATGDQDRAEAAHRSMGTFTDWLLIPLAVSAVLTGVALSLGTHWGLLRHRWVAVKLWSTLAAAGASVLVFRRTVEEAAAHAAAGIPVDDTAGLLAPPLVSLTLYVFLTAVSYVKPWGLTRRGRRLRERERWIRTTRRRVLVAGGPPPRPGGDRAEREGEGEHQAAGRARLAPGQ
ncbi:DUF2269 domain-containing protein [Streptomyces avicenniae]|uniref:DUF2269 domain-containing protein n=1 Tax=Streptomyces avicenniae TaxID=500153 RepID=UPI000AFF645A